MEINKNKLPKRKPKKTFRSVTGYFPSKKNGRSIFFESLLEKTLFLSLEFDNNVLNYLEQPIKLEYKLNNKKTTYHPDCLVNYKKGKSKLIEVKYSSDLVDKKDELEIKFNEARKYAKENDLEFDTFDELYIEPKTLKNMEFLYSFAFYPKDEQKEKLIIDILKKEKELLVNEILELISANKFEQASYLPYIWKLTFENTLKVDYESTQLNMKSLVRIDNE
ncbi:TnsA endonuclease-like protein [Malaciobacter marinus]|jgi:hypothetical protein|uniref:TnsA endonuclease-like protein n=1 Tax=Malaciobacter marinus TaxID=505249 RepID=A0AB36ZZM1_9BACT|nr:TnsA endonuclease N-terminal domain-containing protein [Malaciobacter marinus]PPK61829.1 TnsA endonuclease-like protein [Malaciobacter marinus]